MRIKSLAGAFSPTSSCLSFPFPFGIASGVLYNLAFFDFYELAAGLDEQDSIKSSIMIPDKQAVRCHS
jgi:hypothetical protein